MNLPCLRLAPLSHFSYLPDVPLMITHGGNDVTFSKMHHRVFVVDDLASHDHCKHITQMSQLDSGRLFGDITCRDISGGCVISGGRVIGDGCVICGGRIISGCSVISGCANVAQFEVCCCPALTGLLEHHVGVATFREARCFSHVEMASTWDLSVNGHEASDGVMCHELMV